VEPNVLEAVKLFSQAIKQGSLFTKSGNPQNFSGRRQPFISTEQVPVNQGRTPIPPSFRPNPVSPGQLGLFDIRATPSSFDPSLERTGPPIIPYRPNPPSTFDPSLERIGPPGPLRSLRALDRIGPPGPLRPTESVTLRGEIRSLGPLNVKENLPSTFDPSLERIGPPGPLRSLTGSSALTGGGGSSPSVMDLLKTAGAFGTSGILGALGLAAKLEGSAPAPNYRNLGYTSEADMKGRIAAQELLQSGRYVPGNQQQILPNKTPTPQNTPPANPRPEQTSTSQNTPPANPRPDQNPLPRNTPPGNTMTPASAAFTKFFVDDDNRLSPTAMDLATATGGVQTRDLSSLILGLKAADRENLLNRAASAQMIPATAAPEPNVPASTTSVSDGSLYSTPLPDTYRDPSAGPVKIMGGGARDSAVREQIQQYARGQGTQDTRASKPSALQAQYAQESLKARANIGEIINELGYNALDKAPLRQWAVQNPALAMRLFEQQQAATAEANNLRNRSTLPTPGELAEPGVSQQSPGNVESSITNTSLGSNLTNNAIANSHFRAESAVAPSQGAYDLADATQAMVQPVLITDRQLIEQAPAREYDTAKISDAMLRRAMELKMGQFQTGSYIGG
jgi:hypothetical protein